MNRRALLPFAPFAALLWAWLFASACDQTRPLVDTVPEEGGGSPQGSTSGAAGAGGKGGQGGQAGQGGSAGSGG